LKRRNCVIDNSEYSPPKNDVTVLMPFKLKKISHEIKTILEEQSSKEASKPPTYMHSR
jgi:hypothetical protein